jgi:acetyl-CoA synthetase
VIGAREQRLQGPRSFTDARERHQWQIPEYYNIAVDCLDREAADRLALILAGSGETRRITFGELRQLVMRCQNLLTVGMGIKPGDRVGVLLGQSLEAAVAFLAIMRAGAIAVPMSKLLALDGVNYRVEKSGSTCLVADADSLPLLEQLRQYRPEMRMVIVGSPDPNEEFWALIERASTVAAPVRTRAEDPAAIIFTSGTTGKPKGALHAHRFLPGHVGLDYAFNFYRPDDVFYGPADWAWLGGLMLGLLAPLAWGIPTVVFRARRFDPEETFQMMARERVSLCFFPATALRMMHTGKGRPAEVPPLRVMMTGAEAITPEVFQWVQDELGFPLHNAFGQTEANALIGHCSALNPVNPGALGLVYPGHTVAILGENNQVLPRGEIGQIALKADDPVVMLGYWNDPEATAAKIQSGWLLTGDVASMDDQGVIYFQGRNDDLIKSGGYRIGPVEIESALLAHENIAECAAVGVPDPVRGEVVKVFLRLRKPMESAQIEEELQALAKRTLPAYCRPKAYEVVGDFPRSATGKVARSELRKRHL